MLTNNNVEMRDGLKVAFQQWGSEHSTKILAIHGWLDNSSSFYLIGPHLATLGYHVVAIDQIGHGKSSHVSVDASYSIEAFVANVK